MVLVQMFGHRVRIHLDVGELGGVSLKMYLQVTFRRESTTAYVALERPFARM